MREIVTYTEEQITEDAMKKKDMVPTPVQRYVAHNVRNMLVRILWLAGRAEKGEDGRIIATEIREGVFNIREVLDRIGM